MKRARVFASLLTTTLVTVFGGAVLAGPVDAVTAADATRTSVSTITATAPVLSLTGPEAVELGTSGAYSGTATLDGQPFARRTLTVKRIGPDGTVQLADVKTNSDGAFAFSNTAAVRGSHDYVVAFPGDNNTGASQTTLTTYVHGKELVFAFDPPADPGAGHTLTVSGTLHAKANGSLVGGRSLGVVYTPPTGPNQTLNNVTTDGAGAFSTTIQNAPAGANAFQFTFAGDGTYEPLSATTSVTVSPGEVVFGFEPLDDPGAGQTLTVSGTLKKVDGSVLGNKALTASYTGPSGGPQTIDGVTTDAAGVFHVSITDAPAGLNSFQFSYAGDANNDPASATIGVTVTHVDVLTATAPATLPTNGLLTVSGTLVTATGDPVAGATIHLDRTNGSWTQTVAQDDLTTATDGTFSFQRQVTDGAPLRFHLVYDGDATHRAASASKSWLGVPHLRLTTRKKAYTSGDTASFTVWSPVNASILPLSIVVAPYGKAKQTIPPSATSNQTAFAVILTRNTTVTVSVPKTADWKAETVKLAVPVKARLIEKFVGDYTKVGATHLVHVTTDPRLRVTVKPQRSGKCVYAQVQKYVDGVYKSFRLTECIQLNGLSQASYTLGGRHAAGTQFRFRFQSFADAMSAANNGAWQYFKFTK